MKRLTWDYKGQERKGTLIAINGTRTKLVVKGPTGKVIYATFFGYGKEGRYFIGNSPVRLEGETIESKL